MSAIAIFRLSGQFTATEIVRHFCRMRRLLFFLRVSWISLAGCGAGEEEVAFAGVAGKEYLADVPFITYGAQTRYMLIRNTVGGIVNVGQGLVLPQYLYRCASACATN